MARTSWNPEIGKLPPNKGGKHGGIAPTTDKSVPSAPAVGSSGNPGTKLPWESSDATSLPGEPPALTHLGGS